MKIRYISFVTTFLCCMPFAATLKARCEGDVVPSVGLLTAYSDAIVVGTASPQNVTANSATVAIEVDRVLKGTIPVNTQIQIPFNTRGPQCTVSPSAEPVRAIWFLKVLPNGSLAFADSPNSQSCHPFLSDYEMPEGAVPAGWSYSADANPEDKLAHELAWSIESHQGDGPFALIMNADLLQGASKAEVLQIYDKLYSSTTTDIRLTGMIGLLHLGDAGVLQTVANDVGRFANEPRRSTYLRAGQRLPMHYGGDTPEHNMQTQEWIIATTVGRIVNPSQDTVKQLGRLSRSTTSSTSIRRAAAKALQEIHTPLALTYLAPLLYEDKDPTLRAYAIGGIACFANGVPVLDTTKPNGQLNLNYSSSYKTDATLAHFAMGLPTISQKESYYLDFWRSWWSSNAAAIQAAAVSAASSGNS